MIMGNELQPAVSQIRLLYESAWHCCRLGTYIIRHRDKTCCCCTTTACSLTLYTVLSFLPLLWMSLFAVHSYLSLTFSNLCSRLSLSLYFKTGLPKCTRTRNKHKHRHTQMFLHLRHLNRHLFSGVHLILPISYCHHQNNCWPLHHHQHKHIMSSLRLTSLPEDCLRLVLEPIPIADQLNIQPVCSRFHNTIQHIFNEKSSLKIFATSWDVHRQWDSIEKYDLVDKPDFAVQASPGANDEVVVLEWLKLPFEKLPKVFPKINRLMVNNCRQQFLNSKFFATIRKWSALKHLSLFGLPEDDALSDNFWTELNTFKHLETLNFGFLYRTTISEQLFPLLSQIQSFTLVTYGGGNLEQLLVQMKSLNILNLSYVHLSVDQLHRALEQNHSLAKKLTYLALDFVSTTNGNRKANYQALFQLICNRMTNLRYFDILFGDDVRCWKNLQRFT